VAVIFNNTQAGGGITINLTESQVCRIFKGTINNWSQLGYPSKAIKIVIRNDGSGTSFAFSNHLSKVCPDSNIGTTVTGFSTQSTFASAFPGGVSPANVINDATTAGNGGVVNKVFATDGAIGYAEIGDAINRASIDPGHPQLGYAKIKLKLGNNPAT